MSPVKPSPPQIVISLSHDHGTNTNACMHANTHINQFRHIRSGCAEGSCASRSTHLGVAHLQFWSELSCGFIASATFMWLLKSHSVPTKGASNPSHWERLANALAIDGPCVACHGRLIGPWELCPVELFVSSVAWHGF